MGGMTVRHQRSERLGTPTAKALVKGITAFAIGLLIYALLTLLGGLWGVGPYVQLIEARGTDIGLRVAAASQRLTDGSQRYVFLDADRNWCHALPMQERTACAPSQGVDRRVTAALVEAARSHGAKVAVFDLVAPWPGPKDDPLMEALTRPGETPVVMPMQFDLRRDPDSGNDLPGILPIASGAGLIGKDHGVRFALPAAADQTNSLPDGILRVYPAALRAFGATPAEPLTPFWTLPGLAACLVTQAGNADACATPPETDLHTRVLYSLPMIHDQVEGWGQQQWLPNWLRQAGILWHLPASRELTPDGKGGFNFGSPHLLKDAIVVIGSSYGPSDLHPTPLGVMSGAEVVLNAIRFHVEYSGTEKSKFGKIVLKIAMIFVAALIFGLFWWVHYKYLSVQGHRSLFARAWRSVVSGLGFVVAIAFACLCILAIGWGTVGLLGHKAPSLDMITPILGTMLDGIVDGMATVIHRIEHGVAHLLDKGRRAQRTVAPATQHNRG
ncbi:CHASE2 domain-containing protein [Azospirillum sp. HJ39]|uniref:CHASE2 domain-containing protein n=1 Tax=Azospirillum sp. HJ39 TaxID=3159496 RepID=UPI0035562328